MSGAEQQPWGEWLWEGVKRAGTAALAANDWAGDRLAALFGLDGAHFQDQVDEYLKQHPELTMDDLKEYWENGHQRKIEEAIENGLGHPYAPNTSGSESDG
jgi:FAM177 family